MSSGPESRDTKLSLGDFTALPSLLQHHLRKKVGATGQELTHSQDQDLFTHLNPGTQHRAGEGVALRAGWFNDSRMTKAQGRCSSQEGEGMGKPMGWRAVRERLEPPGA